MISAAISGNVTSLTNQDIDKPEGTDSESSSNLAVLVSIGVNGFMLLAKYSCYGLSWRTGKGGSTVIFSSALDSTCDAITQYVNYSHRGGKDPSQYPLGFLRMRAVGVIICATVNVSIAAMNIQGIITDMIKDNIIPNGWKKEPDEDFFANTVYCMIFGMLLFGFCAKLSLFLWIRTIPGSLNKILATDHLMDACAAVIVLTCFTLSKAFASKVNCLDTIGGLIIPVFALFNYGPLLREGGKQAAGQQAPENICDEITEFVKQENETWNDTFEIESVTVTQDGEGYAVDIDIDVIDEENVTAELLIDVQLHLKNALMDGTRHNISRVDIDYEDQTESAIVEDHTESAIES